ncbi:flavodoxin family protein [Natranaerofaba carboxydovora]|uniref:flavodoxin family protein n=1 Tax=Natranaerofaba carboxydovora TaxID=2742683 RepID=UPI001F149337|nr:flavodoxin family protein [Natranaerofaba carboxydovora]UMZ74356.1 NADPH-dependent FMN reductase [Natranaerofaba carboxydovora]
MSAKILAVSGSPIKDSNIDKTIKKVLEGSGEEGEFVKLSQHDVKPCRACLGCVDDNKCVLRDDYSKELEEKFREADALIIGAYPTFASVDAGTKTFLERTYSLRHNEILTAGKKAAIVAGGFKGNQPVEDWLKLFCKAQQMDVVGSMHTCGNATCLVCGSGETCKVSNVPAVYGCDKIDESMFRNFENIPELQEEAYNLGVKLAEELKN